MDRLLAEGWLRGVEWSGTRWLEVGDRGNGRLEDGICGCCFHGE